MEKIFPTETVTATLLYPITGLFTGTPVLIDKLTAPRRARRAEAAELKARQAKIAAQLAEADAAAFQKKLEAEADPVKRAAMIQARETAQVTARQVQLEQAKAARKASRSKLGDAAGAAALMLIVGGPLIWSLARPYIQTGIGVLIAAWWLAALIYAPSPNTRKEEHDQEVSATTEEKLPGDGSDDEFEDDDEGDFDDDEEDQEDPVEEPVPTSPTPAEIHALTVALTAGKSSVLHTRLASELGAVHPSWQASTKAVKTLLTAAGIPYREGVRTPDGNGPGVHHQDVPPLRSPSQAAPLPPVVANVGAGQSANANANNTANSTPTGDQEVWQVDPDNPSRMFLVRHTTAA
ncbi:hypothetical protein ACFV4P_35420 [Kitasatospora sp. NPDC059795]|uniref:hypothetical protein n=1 Tax=Kitasatospora sp. NPDC059795 TaxID=3346949 RepID=UPI0036640C37